MGLPLRRFPDPSLLIPAQVRPVVFLKIAKNRKEASRFFLLFDPENPYMLSR